MTANDMLRDCLPSSAFSMNSQIAAAKSAALKLDCIDFLASDGEVEEDTTDAGSSSSDVESCSSASTCMGAAELQKNVWRGWKNSAKLSFSKVGANRCRLPDGQTFQRTLLEVIPGTPAGKSCGNAAAAESVSCMQQASVAPGGAVLSSSPPVPKKSMPTEQASACQRKPPGGDAYLSFDPPQRKYPSSPKSPKKRARDALLVRAKSDAWPVKVAASVHDVSGVQLDPSMPAKKRPAFPEELADITHSVVRRLKPGMPAKKQVTRFLTEDTPRMICPPLGLHAMPR